MDFRRRNYIVDNTMTKLFFLFLSPAQGCNMNWIYWTVVTLTPAFFLMKIKTEIIKLSNMSNKSLSTIDF